MLNSKKLSKFSEISHGFFNKNGGVSKGYYKSLNCGIGSKDKKINVKKNLKIVQRKISKVSKEIFLVKQIHSNKFIFLSKNAKVKNRSVYADAIITQKKNFPIAILTADCVPLLLFDKKKKMIAAIHAGWNGALRGVVDKVIKFMLGKGCNRNDITVAVGPSIAQKSYNVKLDFKNKFIKKHKKNKIFFKNSNNLIYFDLPNYVKYQLKLNKISKIDMINIDTYNKKNKFFSARRSLKLRHDDYGRNISIIMIN
ncbi:peptidoglycan editing factor PgeF [Pelagibacterales bacterium SAG-MED43]|nr:peptidoglycan editing factor PgeF [Pelagibacterales bacterium SAG-MED43]